MGGYLYAHWSVRSLSPRSQSLLHAGLLGASLLLLPVTPSLAWKPSGGEEPSVRILGLLTISVGLPYVLLSTTSPIIQAWYTRRHWSALPYRFFALSNLASLLGLLAYPFLVEPNVTLRHQSLGWSMAYGIFVLLCGIAAIAFGRNTTSDSTTTVDGIGGETIKKFERSRCLFLHRKRMKGNRWRVMSTEFTFPAVQRPVMRGNKERTTGRGVLFREGAISSSLVRKCNALRQLS